MTLYQQLHPQNSPNPSNLKQQYQQFCNLAKSRNPQELVQTLIKNNPKFKNVMETVQSLGGDPQTAFYTLAKQKGIDPESILSQLR